MSVKEQISIVDKLKRDSTSDLNLKEEVSKHTSKAIKLHKEWSTKWKNATKKRTKADTDAHRRGMHQYFCGNFK